MGHKRKRHPRGFWTPDRVMAVALKHKTKKSFFTNDYPAYKAAGRLDMLSEACEHMDKSPTAPRSDDYLIAVARDYDCISDLQAFEKSTYNLIDRRSLRDVAFAHMEPVVVNPHYRIVYLLATNNWSYVYIGLTHDFNVRLRAHRRHGKKYVREILKDPDYRAILLTGSIPPKEAAEMERFYIDHCQSLGLNVVNKSLGGALGGKHRKWTKEKCKKIAAQYEYRVDWKNGHHASYLAAIRNSWLEECAAHMEKKRRPSRYTEEDLLNIAQKYNSKSEWKEDDSASFHAAKRLGKKFYRECCAHMPVRIEQRLSRRKKHVKNSSGATGVHPRQNGKWAAQINKKYLGVFETKAEAIAARRSAERERG